MLGNAIYETQVEKLILNKVMTIDFDKSGLKGELREQESMSRHTSWKTGGNADYFYRAADIDDLSEFMSRLPNDMPINWVGFGSNLLVRDGGIDGVVISINGVLSEISQQGETGLKLGAGASCAKVARFAAKHGLSGIEFFAGIPGTIGGALAMNAGAWGGETWNVVEQVETIDRAGLRKFYSKDQFDIAYRSVSLPDGEWFVSAELNLQRSSKEKVDESIKKMLAERAESQPLGQYSCGSVFRNPSNDHAARLIEDCGLKGKKLGGACVSEKHANFIINDTQASSSDIEQLIELVQATVYEKHGIKLIPEVRVIGKKASQEGVGT